MYIDIFKVDINHATDTKKEYRKLARLERKPTVYLEVEKQTNKIVIETVENAPNLEIEDMDVDEPQLDFTTDAFGNKLRGKAAALRRTKTMGKLDETSAKTMDNGELESLKSILMYLD